MINFSVCSKKEVKYCNLYWFRVDAFGLGHWQAEVGFSITFIIAIISMNLVIIWY